MNKKKKSPFSGRRFKVIYKLCLYVSIITVLLTFFSFYFNLNVLGYFHFTSIFVYIFALFIAYQGYVKYTRIIFFILINLSVLTSASFVGQAGSIEYLFLFTIGLPFIMFSFKDEKRYVVLFSCLSGLFWILLVSTKFTLISNTSLDPEIASTYIYPVSLIATILMVSYQLIYTTKLNLKYYNEIFNIKDSAIEESDSKSKFLSTMSHEIRTPLNAIIGLCYVLKNNNPDKRQIENIDALKYSGEILLNLLNRVLDFSKMQSTDIQLDDIPTDLNMVINQIKKIHEPNCARKGLEMHVEVFKKIPPVWIDAVRYNQVINNLISNSIKFTDSGSITLRIKKGTVFNNKINIYTEIIDTGIGIPKEKQDAIWEPFEQASDTTNRIYGGTGLGLPIVKSIIEAMDSQINLRSTEGKGSRFYFKLNLKLVSEDIIKTTLHKKERNFEGKKILLVDDNVINIMVGKQILQKSKFVVSSANDGSAAVKLIKEQSFDVVLMDLNMPVMDGYQATKEIRNLGVKIPILALSASIFSEVKDKIEACGMNGFIYKPFVPEDLLDKIENSLNKAQVDG